MSRPTARKREKKVAREAAARAKVATRRARLTAAREAAAAPDARRNLHVERGRPVVVNDITPFARPKCGKCKNGIAGTTKNDAGEVVGATPCACATTRFYRHHPEIIVTAEGEAFWPLETVPAVDTNGEAG